MSSRKSTKNLTPAGRLEEARLHDVIGYQVAQASIATLSVFHRAAGAALEMRPAEYTLLVLIKENPGGTAARFARALAVTAPNVTLWLDKLERRGLVTRQASETDRRTLHLHVTPRGRQIADESTQRIVEAELVLGWPRVRDVQTAVGSEASQEYIAEVEDRRRATGGDVLHDQPSESSPTTRSTEVISWITSSARRSSRVRWTSASRASWVMKMRIPSFIA